MKIDMHVHSNYSGDSIMGIGGICKRLVKLRFNGFALTDHNTVDGHDEARKFAKAHGLVFVPGIEVSTIEGHILGYGIRKSVPMGLAAHEAIEAIHLQGGLAVAAHPYDPFQKGLKSLVKSLRLDGMEVRNGKDMLGSREAEKVCRELGLAQTGGSDSHSIQEIGSAWTELEGDALLAIRERKTKAKGGFGIASLSSKVERRIRGARLRE